MIQGLALEPAGGQGINGRLLDAETGAPVEGAVVTLRDQRESAVRAVTTTQNGTFSIPVHAPGRYTLRTSRIGYLETVSPPLDVTETEWVEVELRVSMTAIPLAPLTVTSDRPALVLDGRLERWGYYERKAIYGHLGGHFLDHQELESRHPLTLVGVLSTMGGVRVRHLGGRRIAITNRRGRPLSLCIDNMPAGPLTAEAVPVDELVAFSEVLAIEVYPSGIGAHAGPGPACTIRVWTGVPDNSPRSR